MLNSLNQSLLNSVLRIELLRGIITVEMKVEAMAAPPSSHIVIFPFMSHGHIIPVLDLSKAFSSRKLKVSIITTPSNAKYIHRRIARCHRISLIEIPFPSVDGLTQGCENTSQLPSLDSHLLPFLLATKQLRDPFEQILQKMKDSDDLPLCVISDFFLGWTLEVCTKFGVPRLVFHGMGVFSMALCKIIWTYTPHLKTSSVSEPLKLPGIELPFTLTSADVPIPAPSDLVNHDDPFAQLMMEVAEAEAKSWGNVANSFLELEGDYVSSLQSFYSNETKILCVGPLLLHDNSFEETHEENGDSSDMLMEWLDTQERASPGSVIYASFGTQSDVSDAQIEESVLGLENSGYPFLLVIRSASYEIGERGKGKGLITREFIDQRRILFHKATGGFLSHCGWNSVLESMCAAVPILACPITAEQPLNAKFIVDGLGMGIRVEKASDLSSGLDISKEAISQGVRELMGGVRGRRARERARALSHVARRAVAENGSSSAAMDRLIGQLSCTETKFINA